MELSVNKRIFPSSNELSAFCGIGKGFVLLEGKSISLYLIEIVPILLLTLKTITIRFRFGLVWFIT